MHPLPHDSIVWQQSATTHTFTLVGNNDTNHKHMKTKILILVTIIFAGFISSCNEPLEIVSKQELINLIETNQVKQIDVVNRQDAQIILKKEANKPNLTIQIASFEEFAKVIIDIADKHNVSITYTTISASGNPFLFIYPLIMFGGIILYFIGGAICLFLVMKNEFKNPSDKIAWVITVIFAPIIGILLFIVLGRKQIVTPHTKS